MAQLACKPSAAEAEGIWNASTSLYLGISNRGGGGKVSAQNDRGIVANKQLSVVHGSLSDVSESPRKVVKGPEISRIRIKP